MKKLVQRATILLALLVLPASAASAAAIDQPVKAPLVTVGSSGVSGFVQLKQLKDGGTSIVVHARGLQQGTVYTSFYYDDTKCSVGPDELGSFGGHPGGIGKLTSQADDDLDEIHSVSIRLGPGYGTLLACAAVP
jgi:hypothetical protein